MSTSPFAQPDNTSQEPATYKSNIDDAFKVLARIAGMFNCQAQDTPDMTVKILDGAIFAGGNSVTEVSSQNTGTITAPSSNPRIDRVVVDADDGTVSVITGSEAASPTAPSITAGKLPVAQIYLTTSHTEIVNDDITDERQLTLLGLGTMAQQSASNVNITGGSVTGITDLAIADGGTGESTAAAAFSALKQDATTSDTGVVELATDAEAQALSDALKALTPATLDAALKGANQSLASSGVQIWNGGLITMWKKGALSPSLGGLGNASQTINYPDTFPNACFQVLATMQYTSPTSILCTLQGTPGTSSCSINVVNPSSGSYRGTPIIFAIGY